MTIPQSFYYLAKSDQVSFTRTPGNGHPDFNRLIAGQPCWPSNNSPYQQKPKHLILGDWKAKHWSFRKTIQVIKALEELINQGFSLYIWQEGVVEPLSKKKLLSLKKQTVLHGIVAQYPDQIVTSAIEQHPKLNPDQIQIIDSHCISSLLNEEIPKNTFRASDFYFQEYQANLDILLDIASQSHPEIAHIEQDVFHNNSALSSTTKQIAEKFSKTVAETPYRKAILDTSEDIKILCSKPTNQLQQNKVLSVYKLQLSADDMQSLFKALPQLETLDLSGCLIPNVIYQKILLVLQDLNLQGSTINTQNLPLFLKITPNLKILNLSHCQNIAGNLNLSSIKLDVLEILDLHGSTIVGEGVQALLQIMPRLRVLNLSNCKNILNNLNLPLGSLSCLEELYLVGASLADENFQKLLRGLPNLNHLSLSYAHCALILQEKNLFSLRYLTLIEAGIISGEKLGGFLQSNSELEELHVTSIDLKGVLALKINSLLQLTSLSLMSSKISSQNTQTILKATPHVEGLNLSETELLEPLNLESTQLLKLKHFFWKNTNILAPNLQSILQSAPNVTSINLCKAQLSDQKYFTLQKDSLLNLIVLQATGSNLTSDTLEVLLLAAPNLERLEMHKIPISDSLRALLIKRKIQTNLLDPEHDAKEYKDLIPNKHPPFKYQRINQSKNQGMIIEQFSQYLTLTNNDTQLIPKIGKGICVALSHYFLQSTAEDWNKFLDDAVQWDGELNRLPVSLKNAFESLKKNIKQYQLRSTGNRAYLGDDLEFFLNQCTINEPILLGNPWHAIGLRKLSQNQWLVYDPNFINGPKHVSSEALKSLLHNTLGPIISVSLAVQQTHKPRLGNVLITNPDSFLELGGLLVFERDNYSNHGGMFTQLPINKTYSKAALDGLLLRNNDGVPAWVVGLRNPNSMRFTAALLQQLIKRYPRDYRELLEQSVEAMPAKMREKALKLLPPVGFSPIIHCRTRFQTWNTQKPQEISLLEYCQQAIQTEGISRRLIPLTSDIEAESMLYALQHYCLNTSRPVFYINSPDDLLCQIASVKRNPNDNSGTLQKPPGGALHTYLTQKHSIPPVLLINYNNFTADDLVRFNPLLNSKDPKADGSALPPGTVVIGVINTNKPDCYQGSDFYSRFQKKARAPLSSAALLKAIPPIPVSEKAPYSPATHPVINLYQAADWKERLIGRWILNKDALTFQEGALIPLLRNAQENSVIEIHNGLWEQKDFEHFWQQACLIGIDDGSGNRLKIPKGLRLVRKESYDWNALKKRISTVHSGLTNATVPVLNPGSVAELFQRYDVEQNQLVLAKGWIENSASKELSLNVTRDISPDNWGEILQACQTHNVTLKLHCAPGVILPEVLGQQLVPNPAPVSHALHDLNPEESVILIQSTDSDTTLAQLSQETSKKTDMPLIIDISECKASDLLQRLDGTFKATESRFEFTKASAALLKALAAGKKIILTGTFSAELVDALAPVIFAQQKKHTSPRGTLILLTTEPNPLNYCKTYVHKVDTAEKIKALKATPEQLSLLKPFLNEPLARLKTRLKLLQYTNSSNTDLAWQGLLSLPVAPLSKTPLDIKTAAAETEAFIQQRIKDINSILGYSPYAFLTGLSGVGKSTFMKYLSNVYEGESQLTAWAQDTSEKEAILFIDEVNLSPSQQSLFEGLFHNPPGILVDGAFLPLSAKHKVIFAGNPLSYGEGRTLAPFFQRHGNALVFQPLPHAFIYEKMLKPVFVNTPLEAHSEPLSRDILKAYDFLCACSTSELLISPREVQMIALLINILWKNNPKQKLEDISKQVIYQITAPLVPQDQRAAFDLLFKPQSFLPPQAASKPGNFILTPSRHASAALIENFMELREQRRRQPDSNEEQLYGGLGGLVLEGAPGVGKSEMVISLLIGRGYKEVSLQQPDAAPLPENAFYRMPVSMPIEQKKELLLNAFHQGAVVIIDELNSSPMMERFVNDLLMHKSPLDKKRPQKPGFMIIGTQNPVSMAGRQLASTALARRLTTEVVPEYSLQEMKDIIVSKKLLPEEAEFIVTAYDKEAQYAKAHNLKPAPTFRDLLDYVDDRLVAAQKMPLPASQTVDEISDNIVVAAQATKDSSNFSRFWPLLLFIGIIIATVSNIVGFTIAAIGLGMFFWEYRKTEETPKPLSTHSAAIPVSESTQNMMRDLGARVAPVNSKDVDKAPIHIVAINQKAPQINQKAPQEEKEVSSNTIKPR